MKRIELTRNIEAGDLLEILLITSIASLLFIRFFLTLTGYPQVGGHGFHIAHMLWGGFLMLIALILLLSFLGNRTQRISAVIGGIGFGSFIDELGKFITSDNNYFFQPTVALVYIVFILLFFLFRYIEHHRPLSKKEYLMNALRMMEEVVNDDMDKDEQQQLLEFLHNADPKDPLTIQLKHLVTSANSTSKNPSNKVEYIAQQSVEFIKKIATNPISQKLVVLFFVFQSLYSLLTISTLIIFTIEHIPSHIVPIESRFILVGWGQLISTTASTLLMIIGVIMMRFSMFKAYTLFRYSLLVNILFTQFFIFYRIQFHALPGLALNLFILLELEYMLSVLNPHRSFPKERAE